MNTSLSPSIVVLEKSRSSSQGRGYCRLCKFSGYVRYFKPSAIILDEPDSHLHPNNQRLLCKVLQAIADERSTQVFLTTHSRHVVDALSGQARFLWVRNGVVEQIDQDHDLAVLLDIGALDVKEMVTNSQARCVVLTEDSLTRGLRAILDASSPACRGCAHLIVPRLYGSEQLWPSAGSYSVFKSKS